MKYIQKKMIFQSHILMMVFSNFKRKCIEKNIFLQMIQLKMEVIHKIMIDIHKKEVTEDAFVMGVTR